MPKSKPALSLPDSLIVRYFRAGELDQVTKVITSKDGLITVHRSDAKKRVIDHWRDLGGGIGFVPDAE